MSNLLVLFRPATASCMDILQNTLKLKLDLIKIIWQIAWFCWNLLELNSKKFETYLAVCDVTVRKNIFIFLSNPERVFKNTCLTSYEKWIKTNPTNNSKASLAFFFEVVKISYKIPQFIWLYEVV